MTGINERHKSRSDFCVRWDFNSTSAVNLTASETELIKAI